MNKKEPKQTKEIVTKVMTDSWPADEFATYLLKSPNHLHPTPNVGEETLEIHMYYYVWLERVFWPIHGRD